MSHLQKLCPCFSETPVSTSQKFALCHFSELAGLLKHFSLKKPVHMDFLNRCVFFVASWCAVHRQMQRDCMVRGRFCTSAMKRAVEERRACFPLGLQATGLGRGGPCKGGAAAQDRPLVCFVRHTHDRLAALGRWHPRV